MPAFGVLAIDLAWGRGRVRISLPADRTRIVAPAYDPAVSAVPERSQTIPFAAAQVPMPAGGVR